MLLVIQLLWCSCSDDFETFKITCVGCFGKSRESDAEVTISGNSAKMTGI